jgi:hypothetical protein
MPKKEVIDDRIDRLNKHWDDVLTHAGLDKELVEIHETIPEELMKIGLTIKEAKAWLKKEPQYTTDAFSHEPKNRRRLHRILSSINRSRGV